MPNNSMQQIPGFRDTTSGMVWVAVAGRIDGIVYQAMLSPAQMTLTQETVSRLVEAGRFETLVPVCGTDLPLRNAA